MVGASDDVAKNIIALFLQKFTSSKEVSKFFFLFRTDFEFSFRVFLLVLDGIIVVDAFQFHVGLQLVDYFRLSINDQVDSVCISWKLFAVFLIVLQLFNIVLD